MNYDIKELYNLFINIEKKGFIKSKRNGSTGIGYTFEELLNKPEENFPIPDFNSIEIKTYRYKSRQIIHLFSATPDGDFLFPIKRLIDKIGYPDKIIRDARIFNLNFNGKYYNKIGYYKKGKIIVNRLYKKLDFIIFDNKNNKIEINVSWSFELIREKLNLKLKYLSVIGADSKYINNNEYFHYKTIKFYKLKSFDTFLSLIEKGYINICFNIGVFRSGPRTGQIHDRGVGFSISLHDISKLYDEIKC